MANPLSDTWDFLVANTDDHNALGHWKYLLLALFWALVIAGVAVRFAGVLAILFVLHLWLGIYRPGDPAEWTWSYLFLAFLMFFMVLDRAGRSLGVDALLHREVSTVRDGRGLIGRPLNLAG